MDRREQLVVEFTRLRARSTSRGCPPDCDRSVFSGPAGGWSSDHDGRSRRGHYRSGDEQPAALV